jgi:phosphatidylserine/phosphatidylglycerophosphate/cardiolipin synthase-like enzyme
MHLKAYTVYGTVLRTGSANFSASGKRARDDDLIVIRDVGAAAKFGAHFERTWNAAEPQPGRHSLRLRLDHRCELDNRSVANAILGKVPGKPDRLVGRRAWRWTRISVRRASAQCQKVSRRRRFDPIEELTRIRQMPHRARLVTYPSRWRPRGRGRLSLRDRLLYRRAFSARYVPEKMLQGPIWGRPCSPITHSR